MKVTVQDLIKMFQENISDDTIVVDNYSKVVGIVDKVNQEQADMIFSQLIENHETSSKFAKRFQTMFQLFTKQAKPGSINPMEASSLENFQKQSEALSERRSELEFEIGKKFLEKGFITQETFEKYYN